MPDCNIPIGTFGVPYIRDGEKVFYCLTEDQFKIILCHGLSEHSVNTVGGFRAGKGSELSTKGVAIGRDAKVIPGAASDMDAIQIGTGDNVVHKTVQFYNWRLLDALGKIPEDRLPPYKIQLQIENDILQWSYIGTTEWYDIFDISTLQGEDGIGFIPDAWGQLTEQIIIDIANNTDTGRYIYIVDVGGDNRIDNTVPAGIAGDMSGNILGYDADAQTWVNFGAFTGIPGEAGKPVEMQNNGVYIQWRVEGDPSWINLILLSDLKGDKGDKGDTGEDAVTPMFQNNGTHIQYSKDLGVTWINLVALSAIVGPAGEDGANGTPVELRTNAGWLQWKYTTASTWNNIFNLSLLQGADGKNPEFQFNATHLQYRLIGGNGIWINLIHKDDITGAKGDTGLPGEDGSPIELRVYINQLQWKLTSEDNTQWKFLYNMDNLIIDVEVYLSSFVIADWVNENDGYYSLNFNHGREVRLVNIIITNSNYEEVRTYIDYVDANNTKIYVPQAARFDGHVSISSGTVGVEGGSITSQSIVTALGYTPADELQVAADIADAQISVLAPKVVDLTFHTTYTLIPSDAGKILRIIANEGSTRTINIGNDIALLQPITFWREFSGVMIKQGISGMVLSGQGVESNQRTYDIGKYQTTMITKFDNNKVRIL